MYKTATEDQQPVCSITRNGVTLPLYSTILTRGANKNKECPMPIKPHGMADDEYLSNLIRFMGFDNIGRWITNPVFTQTQDFFFGSIDSEGNPDMPTFCNLMQLMEITVKRVSELEEDLDDVNAQIAAYAKKPLASITTEERSNLQTLINRMKDIRAKIEAKRGAKSEE